MHPSDTSPHSEMRFLTCKCLRFELLPIPAVPWFPTYNTHDLNNLLSCQQLEVFNLIFNSVTMTEALLEG
jgi:hypothetical protein